MVSLRRQDNGLCTRCNAERRKNGLPPRLPQEGGNRVRSRSFSNDRGLSLNTSNGGGEGRGSPRVLDKSEERPPPVAAKEAGVGRSSCLTPGCGSSSLLVQQNGFCVSCNKVREPSQSMFLDRHLLYPYPCPSRPPSLPLPLVYHTQPPRVPRSATKIGTLPASAHLPSLGGPNTIRVTRKRPGASYRTRSINSRLDLRPCGKLEPPG